MYKHWKKIALALTAFFWGGCNDNSSSSNEPTACTLTIGCPEYGVAGYYCEDGVHPDDNGQNCTFQPAPKCQKYYHCEDGVSCWAYEDDTTLNCTDKQGKEIKYTQKDFEKNYYEENRY